ncbi:MAG TPA: chromosome segregation SMC family protein [Nitrososphaeraceae archaeon]|nr:chromosome segregation SMC family protein [Nitrososphaeraceae archaeon]
MVYIKKLEIYGFKSFGFKNTVIHFEKGLVAVTGPNGSGKSNVLDAIMFAIGENSPKALRVDKFQSLFHDSQNSLHRLIRVALTFDNANRAIPVNSDSVTLTREMEGHTGESQYYLNEKKVSKSTITDLLEVVMPGPGKLNVVQQGMITRISELNSDERRKIIEDIVGLSYFDDKKTEALKQLEESDRRLEVALAKMGEIRKRIDELEQERNDQLRYEHLESELKRLKAISVSNKISNIRNELESQNRLLDSSTSTAAKTTIHLEEIRTQIESLESEKSAFIKKVDAENKDKAQMASRIASIVYEAERMRAIQKQSENRIVEIQQRIPVLDSETKNVIEHLEEFRTKVMQNKEILDDRSAKVLALRSELNNVNSEIEVLTSRNANHARSKAVLDRRYKWISAIRDNIAVSKARLEEKIRLKSDEIVMSDLRISSCKAEIDNFKATLTGLYTSQEQYTSKLDSTKRLLGILKNSKIRLEQELSSSVNLLSKGENLAMTHEISQDIARNVKGEDVTIAKLIKHGVADGIKEIAHNVIKYDKKYERAILAAASEWLKALLVYDSKSMISIARYVKSRKLPRLKMIPLDILEHVERSEALNYDVNVIGNLADFVYSDYKALPLFLCGNTYLVKNSTAAYMLAQNGYRTVTMDGILFEPSGRGLLLDFGSQVSDLSKAILLEESVEGLRSSLTKLKLLMERRNSELVENASRLSDLEVEKVNAEANIAGLQLQLSTIEASMNLKKKELDRVILENSAALLEKDSWISELKRYNMQMLLLTNIINALNSRIQDIEHVLAYNEESRLNTRKNYMLRSIEELDIEIRQLTMTALSLNNRVEMYGQSLRAIDEQKQSLTCELEELTEQLKSLTLNLESIESELGILRDKEQQVIDSSGSSYSVLQEYEQKIKGLRENEKKISRELNAIEKEIAMLKRDIADNSSEQSNLHNDLVSLGYDEEDKMEVFDVDFTIKELTSELESTRAKINLRADESYVQVIEGYRGISTRQNQLESERSSIVLFIEGVVNEKNAVFMDAFRKVDEDIRTTFSEVTGGQAWLEIENIDDVFSSGVMLMVQFPGKPGRESTSLSGGEKTIAAAIFLLALQSLKPSPFYLMDEIDAHLDAENNDRLSRILLSRSRDNQIVIVTLKDTTVSKANLIYGVYPKEGMSQVVKYKQSNDQVVREIASKNV